MSGEREKQLRALLKTPNGNFLNHFLISTGRGLVSEDYGSSDTFEEVLISKKF